MKAKFVFLQLLIASLCVSQTAPPMKIAGTFTPVIMGEDPNLNPSWDWINGDVQPSGYPRYIIYFQNQPRPGEEWQYLPPWLQGDSWPGLLDRFKEDGWILLARDFGSPTRRVAPDGNVYFVLYNKYRSVLRVFYLIRKAQQNFQYAMMTLTWREPDSKITGSLTSLTHYCEALDKVLNTKDNATMSVLSADPLVDNWVYADFPLVLDDVYKAATTVNPPSLLIKITGITDTQLQMSIEGFAAEGDADFIKDYMTGNPLGSVNFSMNRLNLPQLGKLFNIGTPKITGTQVDWNALLQYFKDIKMPKLPIGSLFKGLFDDFNIKMDNLSLSSPLSVAGIDVMGLYNYFTAGGMKVNYIQTAPTYTSSQFIAQGLLKSSSSLGTLTIPLPATRTNYKESFEGGEIGLCYNDPVGILTLTKTPSLFAKFFSIGMEGPCGVSEGWMWEYEIAEYPQITLNSSNGLELKSCEVSIVAPIIEEICMSEEVKWVIDRVSIKNQRHLIVFESPISNNAGYVASLPVPIQFSKGRTLQVAGNTPGTEVKIKIKAILQRKDDPAAQPVVFVATYNTVTEFRTDKPTQQILPTIPPQKVICSVPNVGAVRVSWDRNKEKSIKYYAVERSINNGTYIQLGTTPDTIFVDNEVQKAVKPYKATRQNVSVNYRVRALSEWTEGVTVKTQFSVYSSVINITGSVGYLWKDADSQIIPESHSMSQNFPNPFNPSTTIHYSVPEESFITLKVYNTLGQEIVELVNNRKEVGYHYVEWNASGYPSGVYYYRITNGRFTETKRMVLAK